MVKATIKWMAAREEALGSEGMSPVDNYALNVFCLLKEGPKDMELPDRHIPEKPYVLSYF